MGLPYELFDLLMLYPEWTSDIFTLLKTKWTEGKRSPKDLHKVNQEWFTFHHITQRGYETLYCPMRYGVLF